MEIQIVVTVRVNDLNHAEIIKDDILEAVKKRTTIYHISKIKIPEIFINELFNDKI